MRPARATWMKAFETQLGLWVKFSDPDFTRRFQPHDEALEEQIPRERMRLFIAEPFFVSAEMCDLVAAAARTFTPEPFAETDVLTHSGFLLFERPVTLRGSDYAAFSWSLMKMATDSQTPWGIGIGIHLANGGFEPHERNLGAIPDRQPGGLQVAQTTLRLMLEFKPASRYKQRPDRAARRAAYRTGFAEREVTVVRLRRERSLSEQLGGVANYSCRFMVSGHWRNQWCPALGRHRQTWIAPYVKGPDDKPFRPTRGRAFTFTR